MVPLNKIALSDRTTFVDTVEIMQAAVGGILQACKVDDIEEKNRLLQEEVETMTDQLRDVQINEANYGEAREELYSMLDDATELLKTTGLLDDDDYDTVTETVGEDDPPSPPVLNEPKDKHSGGQKSERHLDKTKGGLQLAVPSESSEPAAEDEAGAATAVLEQRRNDRRSSTPPMGVLPPDTNVEQVGKDVFDDLMTRKGSEDDDDSDDSSGDGGNSRAVIAANASKEAMKRARESNEQNDKRKRYKAEKKKMAQFQKQARARKRKRSSKVRSDPSSSSATGAEETSASRHLEFPPEEYVGNNKRSKKRKERDHEENEESGK